MRIPMFLIGLWFAAYAHVATAAVIIDDPDKPSNMLSSDIFGSIAAEDFSGIYARYLTKEVELLSVHIKGSEVILVDLSDHLNFLQNISYISEQEAEGGIAVTAYDRTFYGTIFKPDYFSIRLYEAYLDPLLPLQQRISQQSQGLTVHSYELDKDVFINLSFVINENQETSQQTHEMIISRMTPTVLAIPDSKDFIYYGYIKVF